MGFDSLPSQFDETKWSLIDRVLQNDSAETRTALNELLQIYMPALFAYLTRRRRIPHDQAQDLLHEFIVNRILEKDLIQRADRERGRFRALLLSSLDRFLIDQHRYRKARVRDGGILVNIEMASPAVNKGAPDQADSFDAAWARTVLREALTSMWTQCRIGQKEHVWDVFCQRVLIPLLTDSDPPSYDRLVGRNGITDVRIAQNLLVTAKRMLQRHLRAIVNEYAAEDEVDDEIQSLYQVLANSPGQETEILTPALRDYLQLDLHQSTVDYDTVSHSQIGLLFRVAPEQELKVSLSDPASVVSGVMMSPLATLLDWDNSRQDDSEWYDATLEQLFDDPHPPLDLLMAVKNLARSWTAKSDIETQRACGAIVYFLAIATAELRCQQRISRSDNAKLSKGITLLLQRSFLLPAHRSTLEQFVGQLQR